MSGRERDLDEHVESGLVGHFLAKPVAAADVRTLLAPKP